VDSHVTTACRAPGWLGASMSMLHAVARSPYARTRSGSGEQDLGLKMRSCVSSRARRGNHTSTADTNLCLEGCLRGRVRA
jgi:hypothetical protein